jgi:hypothetical protein
MPRHGLYQPKIADEHIRNLYQWAKRLNVPMTHLLNTLLAHALVRLEQGVENVYEATPEAYGQRKSRREENQ